MNVFVVDADPRNSAMMLCDKHVSKMILESAQLLSCVVRTQATGRIAKKIYKRTHRRHPCTLWAGESAANFRWLVEHARALSDEFTYRHGRTHKSSLIVEECFRYLTEKRIVFRHRGLTVFAQAMPDHVRCKKPNVSGVVRAYRRYYITHKAHLLTYTKRKPPAWLRGCFEWESR